MQEKARQAISWPEAAAAARREILFLHHMAGVHGASLDVLGAEGERRHLTERARRTDFVTTAREALGEQHILSCLHHRVSRAPLDLQCFWPRIGSFLQQMIE